MSIIIVSRGSYSRGKEIAEKLAERLGHDCISRDTLFNNLEELDSRDAKLVRSIEDIPSIFSRFQSGKETYIAYIQSTLLQKLRKDNVVYEGFVGHVFLKDIPNILKIRIISDYDDRANIVSERDKITKDQALKFIKKIDDQRKKWSQYLYGIDPSDPNQYDLVINVKQIPVETIVDTLVQISGLEQFQLTNEAKKKMDNLAMAAQVRNTLLRTQSDLKVSAEEGKIFIYTETSNNSKSDLISEMKQLFKTVPDLRQINLDLSISVPLSREKVRETYVMKP